VATHDYPAPQSTLRRSWAAGQLTHDLQFRGARLAPRHAITHDCLAPQISVSTIFASGDRVQLRGPPRALTTSPLPAL